MTDDRSMLLELLAKATDASVLRQVTGFAAERLMELKLGALNAAAVG